MSVNAAAASDVGNMFSYGGFGTLGFAHSDTDRAEYVIGNQMSGARDNFDWKTDSRFGVQATFSPAQWLSGTVQVLAEVRDSSEVTTQAEWAFLKLRPTSNLDVRAGKLQLPLFLISDTRNVGIANTWLRAPDAVYGEAIFDTYVGGDITYTEPLGEFLLTGQVLGGSVNPATQLSQPGAADIFTGHRLLGYSLSADLRSVTVRASVVELQYNRYIIDAPVEHGTYDFYDVGATYDYANLLVQGEFIELRTGDPDDNINGWYLMRGYHLPKWLPYVIYADNHKNRGANGAIPELNAATISVGVRYNVLQSVDIKAQFDHVKALDFGSPFINIQPGFRNAANIFSLVVDFAF
jgi:hypothetical protein